MILDNTGNKFFVGCLTEILNKTSEIILDPKTPTYQDKIEGCSLLSVLGFNLDSVADLVRKYYAKDVLSTLDVAMRHRVAKVQSAARNAKAVWDEVITKGISLENSKIETEHLNSQNNIVTPDDMVKVKSGHGNVNDAKTLGYLNKRKPRKANASPQKNEYQEKRSRSKIQNSETNIERSRMLNERIIKMESQRQDLNKKADRLKVKKEHNNIDHIMQKYQKENSSKSRSKGRERENVLGKIKQRVGNMPKGASIEIHESRRGKEMRLRKEQENQNSHSPQFHKSRRERDESLDHEGGEGDQEAKIEEQDDQPNENNDLQIDEQPQEEDENMFDEEEIAGGDQAFNAPTMSENPITHQNPKVKTPEKEIKKDSPKDRKPSNKKTPPRNDLDLEDTLERELPGTAQSKNPHEESKEAIDMKMLFDAKIAKEKSKIEDDELDQMEYEKELLQKYEQQKVNIQHSEYADSSKAPLTDKKKISPPKAPRNVPNEKIIEENEIEDQMAYEEELMRQQNVKPKMQHDPQPIKGNVPQPKKQSTKKQEMDNDSIQDQMDYEDELLRQQNIKTKMKRDEPPVKKITPQNDEDFMEEQMNYEDQLLKQQRKKPKMQRDEDQNYVGKFLLHLTNLSYVVSNNEEHKQKAKRDHDLQNLKKKQTNVKINQDIDDEVQSSEHSNKQEVTTKVKQDTKTINKKKPIPPQTEAMPDKIREYYDNDKEYHRRSNYEDDRDNAHEREYRNRRTYQDDFDYDSRGGHQNRQYEDNRSSNYRNPPPYVIYPPMYPTQPMNPIMTPHVYNTGYSPGGIQTPQFQFGDMQMANTDQNFYQPQHRNLFHPIDHHSPINDKINRVLVYDQEMQTSEFEPDQFKQPVEEQPDTHMERQDLKSLVHNYQTHKKVAEPVRQSPSKILDNSDVQHSFAASPSDRVDPNSKSSIIILDPVTRAWMDALVFLESEDYQSAFETVLSMGDDIYLLRLVSHTGPVVKYLHPKTSALVVKRLNKIIRCNILQDFAMTWIEDSYKSGHFQTFKNTEKNEYLDTLDLFSEDKNDQDLAEKAQVLYQNIIEDEMAHQESD